MKTRLKHWRWAALFSGLVTGASQNACAENDFSIGVEGFHDVYKEYARQDNGLPINVDTHTDYGSITGSYTHLGEYYFSAIDGRYSQGDSNYKSISGTANNIPDKEGEVRLRTGIQMIRWHGVLMPYIGAGVRLFYDKFKEAGPGGYDRHISQFYIPIGMTYRYETADHWTMTPTVEVDPLLLGKVTSHLGNLGAPYTDTTNTQHSGVGLRGDFMIGQKYHYFSWEAGPFVRYWHVSDSAVTLTPALGAGVGVIEPRNTRLQYGLGFRLNY